MASPLIDGTRTETFIVINFRERLAIIGGTSYGGEIKKTIFTVLNYLLPLAGVMSMHCSANVDGGDAALFFGLSGTGKTTLSADPSRQLIGDDEHGWSDNGVFNFEDGCYAKVIRLSPTAEPQIYECTRRFGTILENVALDLPTRFLDLNEDRLTENTRAAYPLDYIDHALPAKMAGHPTNVVLLTCDASGVLPPISRLTPDQAMYHFVSGYTSKIAGTEIGLGVEPEITFSTCFGAPFMVHRPSVYAELLKARILRYGSSCWLVNTGWTGGPFGVGKRISIQHTRALLNDALSGKLHDVPFRKDPIFGFEVPTVCEGVTDRHSRSGEHLAQPRRVFPQVRCSGGEVHRELQAVRRRLSGRGSQGRAETAQQQRRGGLAAFGHSAPVPRGKRTSAPDRRFGLVHLQVDIAAVHSCEDVVEKPSILELRAAQMGARTAYQQVHNAVHFEVGEFMDMAADDVGNPVPFCDLMQASVRVLHQHRERSTRAGERKRISACCRDVMQGPVRENRVPADRGLPTGCCSAP